MIWELVFNLAISNFAALGQLRRMQEHKEELEITGLQEHGGVTNRKRFVSVRGEARFPPSELSANFKNLSNK